jgi:hypothetical protein
LEESTAFLEGEVTRRGLLTGACAGAADGGGTTDGAAWCELGAMQRGSHGGPASMGQHSSNNDALLQFKVKCLNDVSDLLAPALRGAGPGAATSTSTSTNTAGRGDSMSAVALSSAYFPGEFDADWVLQPCIMQ